MSSSVIAWSRVQAPHRAYGTIFCIFGPFAMDPSQPCIFFATLAAALLAPMCCRAGLDGRFRARRGARAGLAQRQCNGMHAWSTPIRLCMALVFCTLAEQLGAQRRPPAEPAAPPTPPLRCWAAAHRARACTTWVVGARATARILTFQAGFGYRIFLLRTHYLDHPPRIRVATLMTIDGGFRNLALNSLWVLGVGAYPVILADRLPRV
jgi:hypothetical protein